jgi:phosphopantothenoylcysteine decarboxylase/phosphopantothenate--cysteine ligase
MNPGRLVIGVSGGIAAFKSAALVSQLVQDGAEVTVVLTPAARQFIGATTFAALTGRPVVTDLFDPHYPLGAHIQLASDAQLLCIAPASADCLSKMAHALADDLLSTLYLCFRGPVLVAPAMNHQMWQHVAVQRNVQQLRDDGVQVVEPGAGWLSCRETGTGRMAEPPVIAQAIARLLAGATKQS